MSKKKTKYALFGIGGLIQLLGVICLFFFPFGTVLGIFLIIAGQIASKRFLCPKCGNPVAKTALLCPVCKEDLQ